ncbi:hypothetical protein Lser_V15G10580 [Lactuca serriola]
MSTPQHLRYHRCCRSGSVVLPYPSRMSDEFMALFTNDHFLRDIRAYISMFSMTSFGADVDDDVNDSRGPFVFKISGQISHKIGSLYPDPQKGPQFLYLYLFDTENEVDNRLRVFDGPRKPNLDASIVLFLVSNVPDRRYDLPSPGSLGCIVSGDDSNCTAYDIVVHSNSGRPQHGWSPRLKLRNEIGVNAQNLTVNMYYAYHIHARHGIWSPILSALRLFQQYLVDADTCIEAARLDYISKHQDSLRSKYVSGLYDALSKGNREGRFVGKRVFLPTSFTGGTRYMYSHYQDALAICRVYGNLQYFITFICNVKWPEIRRYMDRYHEKDPNSRAYIIARVFKVKVHGFVDFLKQDKTFGDVDAYLYTIEFQKRGLPHCHTLLWVNSSSKIRHAEDVDRYITAELPDPVAEPALYRTITACMIHGPCGPLNEKAPCMKDGKCKKRFPNPFLESTFFDSDGYVCYKRSSAAKHITPCGIPIDNV